MTILKNVQRMEQFRITSGLLVVCILMLAIPVVSAATSGSASSEPLAGLSGVPNLLQEKPKLQYTIEDWKKDAAFAKSTGNYITAIKALNKAEEIANANKRGSDGSYIGYYQTMEDLENQKAVVYSNWSGHEALAKKADQSSASFRSNWVNIRPPEDDYSPLPLPVWVPVAAILAAIMLVRYGRRL
jgi:hypothetical protein